MRVLYLQPSVICTCTWTCVCNVPKHIHTPAPMHTHTHTCHNVARAGGRRRDPNCKTTGVVEQGILDVSVLEARFADVATCPRSDMLAGALVHQDAAEAIVVEVGHEHHWRRVRRIVHLDVMRVAKSRHPRGTVGEALLAAAC